MAFAPRPVRWLFMLMAGWLVLAAMRNAVAGDLEVGPLFDRYVHDAVLLLAGALCVLRAVLRREERLAWALIGAGVLAWTLGEIYYTGVLWTAETVPLPSPADVGYLLMPPLVLAGLIVLLRGRTKGDVPGTLRADGLTAALAVGAVSAAIVFDTALGFAPGDPLGIATVLSYPIGDLVLGGFVIGALARAGWRLDRTWFLLGAGILTFWLADSLYLVEVANGTFESGSWFDAGWWVGLTLIAAAAWQPLPAPAKAPQEGLRLIVMPLSFGDGGPRTAHLRLLRAAERAGGGARRRRAIGGHGAPDLHVPRERPDAPSLARRGTDGRAHRPAEQACPDPGPGSDDSRRRR